MDVFFYGLFMDRQLLAARQIEPARVETGFVDGYALRIGERATLVPKPGARVYGLVMDIRSDDIARLYADDSVADYVPEPMVVDVAGGARIDATCYVLPTNKLSGTNKRYAAELLRVATRLEFPDAYLEEIGRLQS